MSLPSLSFAGQKMDTDSLRVLAIIHHHTLEANARKNKRQRVNYIAEGAILSLHLHEGETIKETQVEEVGENYLIVSGGKRVALEEIQKIKMGKNSNNIASKIFGGIVLAIGIIATFLVLWAAAYAAAAFLGFLLLWIPGGLWGEALLRKYPAFKLNKKKLSLETVPFSRLSAKARQKLSRQSRFYRKGVREL